ncbi:transglutaminase-like putative cysteine protease [Mucilaginibacter gracilis]|uniref:Transglutaminase-like putative cysteine protease n=1 Tax=Mucilaginibacter gracilis TaxID=423350 RepID=A0A495IZF8_9SPHI|nr:transglutaminase family protein [Mucilaginibacter gracilis]RKR81488.1 transglutaminase-like putative cysteine protease [Mucilaginibacter gracilis]
MPEFKIHHVTRYSYESPVRDSANQIILYPIQDEYQTVIKHQLKISGEPHVDTHIDHYGNEIGAFTYIEPHTHLEISSKVWVTTKHRMFPVDDVLASQQWADLLNLRYEVSYIDFLRQEYFEGLAEMQAIVANQTQSNETPYQTAVRYCKYVYENFEYIKGVTTVETTLDEIWKLKAGVCQDFAHILMEMLRVINVPARYVSGYICTTKSTSMRGEGATHAWVEAYIPNYGWLGLDPTNNIIANENHVRLAVGRNFTDCTPVKGVYKGASFHTLEVTVSVGNEDDLEEPVDYENVHHDVPVVKPIKPVVKNSYREYLEMIQQQQQQQQQ